MGNHPKHPKCPGCKKALYKMFLKGERSKKTEPFRFCRYDMCSLYGKDQADEQTQSKNDELVKALLFCEHDKSCK